MRSARVAPSLAASSGASAAAAKTPRQLTRRSLGPASILCLSLLAACAAPVPEQAAPEPQAQPAAAVAAAPAPEPVRPVGLRPGEPEPGTREARNRARDLAREAAQLLNEGQLARATEEIAVARRLDPDNALASCLERGIEVDPMQALGRESTDYRVRAGDTLGGLAERVLGDACQFYLLARYNDIEVPRQLEAGRTIRLPGKLSLAPASARPEGQAQPSPAQASTQQPVQQPAQEPAQEPAQKPARQPEAATGSAQVPAPATAGSTTDTSVTPAAGSGGGAGSAVTSGSGVAPTTSATTGSDPATTVRSAPAAQEGVAPSTSTQTVGGSPQPGAATASGVAPGPAAPAAAPTAPTAAPASSAGSTATSSSVAPTPVSVRPPLSAEAQAEIARLHRRAQSAFRRQDLATAIGAWSRVLDIDPENSLARARREEALEMQKRLRGLK